MSCWGSFSSVARFAKVSSVTHGGCIKYGAGQFRELHSASASNVERSGRLLSVACDCDLQRITGYLAEAYIETHKVQFDSTW